MAAPEVATIRSNCNLVPLAAPAALKTVLNVVFTAIISATVVATSVTGKLIVTHGSTLSSNTAQLLTNLLSAILCSSLLRENIVVLNVPLLLMMLVQQ